MKIQPINFIKRHHEPIAWLVLGGCAGIVIGEMLDRFDKSYENALNRGKMRNYERSKDSFRNVK